MSWLLVAAKLKLAIMACLMHAAALPCVRMVRSVLKTVLASHLSLQVSFECIQAMAWPYTSQPANNAYRFNHHARMMCQARHAQAESGNLSNKAP
jgi:hypothetical protein